MYYDDDKCKQENKKKTVNMKGELFGFLAAEHPDKM